MGRRLGRFSGRMLAGSEIESGPRRFFRGSARSFDVDSLRLPANLYDVYMGSSVATLGPSRAV